MPRTRSGTLADEGVASSNLDLSPPGDFPHARARRSPLACKPIAFDSHRDVLASAGAHLHELRAREPGRRGLLQRLWRRARYDDLSARGPQDGHSVVLRRDRVDSARGVDGSGGVAGAIGALLRADEGDRRVARRHGGEVHRRCGDGGVRHPGWRTRTTRCGPAGRRWRCATRCQSSGSAAGSV